MSMISTSLKILEPNCDRVDNSISSGATSVFHLTVRNLCHTLKFESKKHLKPFNLIHKFKWKYVAFILACIYLCIDVCSRIRFQIEFV
jgi:hypothetical protein